MWYFIHARDTTDSLEKRKAARPDHIARLTALRDEGRLLVAGPRAVAMYLARTHTQDSYPDLGRGFGGKNRPCHARGKCAFASRH